MKSFPSTHIKICAKHALHVTCSFNSNTLCNCFVGSISQLKDWEVNKMYSYVLKCVIIVSSSSWCFHWIWFNLKSTCHKDISWKVVFISFEMLFSYSSECIYYWTRCHLKWLHWMQIALTLSNECHMSAYFPGQSETLNKSFFFWQIRVSFLHCTCITFGKWTNNSLVCDSWKLHTNNFKIPLSIITNANLSFFATDSHNPTYLMWFCEYHHHHHHSHR